VNDIVPELIAHGSILRGTLGISIAESWAPDGTERQVITVQKINTAQSLFQIHDTILALDDQPVTRRYDVRKYLSRARIGTTVTVKIQRGQAQLSIPAVVMVRS
ncbi:MAG: PDZ domain-containing protein, partial [Roseiflexaceae bacterium]